MNILNENLFNKATTNFLARAKGYDKRIKDINGILIVNYNSKDLPEEYFTNFLSETGNQKEKDFLNTLKLLINSNKNILDKGFEIAELQDYKHKATKRLLNIINSHEDTNIASISGIIKCKYKKETGCQIYLSYNSVDNIYEIILIDLFHLGLPAPFKVRKGTILNGGERKNYEKHRKNKYDMVNILNP